MRPSSTTLAFAPSIGIGSRITGEHSRYRSPHAAGVCTAKRPVLSRTSMTAAPLVATAPKAASLAFNAVAKTPDALFQSLFIALGVTALLLKVGDRDWTQKDKNAEEAPPAGVRSLQMRFLAVFWMMRMADWLQGPYFYEVYASESPFALTDKLPLHAPTIVTQGKMRSRMPHILVGCPFAPGEGTLFIVSRLLHSQIARTRAKPVSI